MWCYESCMTRVITVTHLLPPLLRRALQLSRLVIFRVEQVDVIRRVADQNLLTVLAVAQRSHATRLVGQVSGNKPHAHARRPPAHVVTCGWERESLTIWLISWRDMPLVGPSDHHTLCCSLFQKPRQSSGPKLWNSLPRILRTALMLFKTFFVCILKF